MEHDSSTPASRRVEAYLDVILAPLARRLSPFHREELRRELRAHLWARVEAYRELGQPEDEAVTEALCQFGGAEDFTRQWLREWTKTPSRVTLHEVWEAARPALRLSLVALLLAPATVALAGFLAFQSQIGGPFLGALFNVYLISVVFLSPVALGLAQRHQAARRPGSGMFAALSMEIVGLSALIWLAGRFLPDQSRSIQSLNALLLLAFFWLPIACASAAFGGRLAWRSKARRGA